MINYFRRQWQILRLQCQYQIIKDHALRLEEIGEYVLASDMSIIALDLQSDIKELKGKA